MTSTVDPKIIDLLNQKKEGDLPFPSLEYFPPRSDEGVKNLYSRMDRMKETIRPLFTDVTWGAGGSTATLSMDIALQAHNTGHVANLHMTCTNMSLPSDDPSAAASPKDLIKSALQTASMVAFATLWHSAVILPQDKMNGRPLKVVSRVHSIWYTLFVPNLATNLEFLLRDIPRDIPMPFL
ncbi:Methylenetetrahydrofolate reductase [Fragilaria crotonensis]|nr:Methylenetetrahydrofolate reductase [Fragilaria crotonensis]